jgi:hypothetical protein
MIEMCMSKSRHRQKRKTCAEGGGNWSVDSHADS